MKNESNAPFCRTDVRYAAIGLIIALQAILLSAVAEATLPDEKAWYVGSTFCIYVLCIACSFLGQRRYAFNVATPVRLSTVIWFALFALTNGILTTYLAYCVKVLLQRLPLMIHGNGILAFAFAVSITSVLGFFVNKKILVASDS